MMRYNKLICTFAVVGLIPACSREAVPELEKLPVEEESATDINEDEGRSFELRVMADYPTLESDTKVSFTESESGSTLGWLGTENASAIVASTSCTTNSQCVSNALGSVSKGVFAGTVRVGNLKATDLRAIVVPDEAQAFVKYTSSQFRIVCPIPTDQIQERSAEVNPAYFPFFAPITSTDLKEDDNGKVISDIDLHSASNMIRLAVFGKHADMEDDEILKTVRLDASDRFSGTMEYIIKDGNKSFNSNGPHYVTVSLMEEVTLADKDRSNAPVLYVSASMGGKRTVTKITVITDKAAYTQSVSLEFPQKNALGNFIVYPFALNLGNGKWTRTEAAIQWSTDAGSTWSTEFPAAGFTALAAKTTSARPLTILDIEQIHDAITANPEPVDLDLSQATLTQEVWPDVFKSTSDAPDTKLKSIKFPSNVTEISREAFAWCMGLESVDLGTKITTINTKAFYHSGLVHLTVPSTVSSMPGWLTFGCCPNLQTVYYNSKAGQIGGNGSTGNNHAHFAYADMTLDYGTNNPTEVTETANSTSNPLIFTVGPNSPRLPRYMFRYNRKLTKLVFESAPTLSNYAFEHTLGLSEMDFSAVTSMPTNATPGSNIGIAPGTSADRKLIVPASLVGTIAEQDPWKNMVLQNGFDIIESSPDATSPSGSVDVRVGSYNIRIATADTSDENKKWATRRPLLVQSILADDFDIFGIQEATNPSAAASQQHNHLREDLGSVYGFVFFRPNAGSNNESVGIAYKKADWEMVNVKTFWVGPDPNKRTASDKPTTGTYAGSSFYRGAITSVLKHKSTGIKVFFMCAHGMLSSADNATYSVVYSSQEALLNPDGLPSFFVGDLNVNPAHESSVHYRTYWSDTFLSLDESARGGSEYTFNGYTAPEGKSRIDYIYYKGTGVTPTYYECDNTLYGADSNIYPSDHFPIFADFTITAE
ncbi:MAG: leucine-rich repeat protein [Bacteroidales bacterium]|nr:leucine-rich repeat protein [Bacteroidales bacterium]